MFKETFVLSDITGILLDSIKIFGTRNTLQLGNVITQETDFYIRTINGKMTIYPATPYDFYYLIAKRTIEATKLIIEISDFNISSSLFKKERGEDKVFSDYLPKTNSNPKMPSIQTSNGKNCRNCSKSNVCKYQEIVIEEVERLIGELEKKELPLSVNINCNEFYQKNTGNVR